MGFNSAFKGLNMKRVMQGWRNCRRLFRLLDTSSRNNAKDLEQTFEFLGVLFFWRPSFIHHPFRKFWAFWGSKKGEFLI